MIIAVDDAIPFWREAFEQAGSLRPFSARSLTSRMLADTDALVVRSVTKVDADLLEGSRVRFVGTATIGMDHLDLPYLRSRGIRCVSAQGSNADAVAEYVTAALLCLAGRRSWVLRNTSLAVIGAGNIGSRVARRAAALGMEVGLCDPPLREATGNPVYQTLGEVLEADIISLHVPLTRQARYPTYRMLDGRLIARLGKRQLLINTSRGEVVVEQELKTALKRGRLGGAALDVWTREPAIDLELLETVEIGTPHIAGYSLDGKARATAMILQEFCRFFGILHGWDWSGVLPAPVRVVLEPGVIEQEAIASAVLQAYPIGQDDAALRKLGGLPANQVARDFDRLRDGYSLRREFRDFIVTLPAEDGQLAATLRALGFQTSQPANETERGSMEA